MAIKKYTNYETNKNLNNPKLYLYSRDKNFLLS